jgi:hypothetical protein
MTEKIVGNWQGKQNGAFVRELILIRQIDLKLILSSTILVDVTAEYTRMDFGYLSCNWSETLVDSSNGFFYENTIVFDIPGIDKINSQWLEKHKQVTIIALWRDNNKCNWITGDKQTGLKLTYVKSIGARRISIVLSGALSNASRELANNIDLATMLVSV